MEVPAAKIRAALWLGISFSVFSQWNIATAKVSASEAKRFATDQRDGLRFNLADVPRGKRFLWQKGKGLRLEEWRPRPNSSCNASEKDFPALFSFYTALAGKTAMLPKHFQCF